MRRLIFCVCVLILAGCRPEQAATAVRVTVPPTVQGVALATPIPTTSVPPTLTYTPTPTRTATHTATATATASLTPVPTDTLTPSLTPTLAPVDMFAFQRPFTREQVDYVDRTYPYGMGELRGLPIHHGVDIQNPRGTPILAVADGTVYYAGDDRTRLFGPIPNYYGNLVILMHDILSLDGLPVYTLYGHMQRVDVETGERVAAGDKIGVVGGTGVAFGPHLHLEVRVGNPDSFGSSRNPDWWILPYPGYGMIAGRVRNPDGTIPTELTVIVRRAGLTGGIPRYAYTYSADPLINRDPAWREDFTLGDLEADDYDVIVSETNGRIRFRETVVVEAGRTTWVDITLRP